MIDSFQHIYTLIFAQLHQVTYIVGLLYSSVIITVDELSQSLTVSWWPWVSDSAALGQALHPISPAGSQRPCLKIHTGVCRPFPTRQQQQLLGASPCTELNPPLTEREEPGRQT